MSTSTRAVVQSLLSSFAEGKRTEQPYRHWTITDCLPADDARTIVELPFAAPDLGGVSGKRELHNNTRVYFDAENQGKFGVVKSVSEAFQSQEIVKAVQSTFQTKLGGSYVRIEYAQDIDGFWLEPHTDLGVKLFTLLLYLSTDPRHTDLGTDIYDSEKRRVGRSPFIFNSALVFVPSTNTYHGFDRRPIPGVRKSLIVNYVTNEWRAREQLAFPTTPVAG
jgi:hypothetical protein